MVARSSLVQVIEEKSSLSLSHNICNSKTTICRNQTLLRMMFSFIKQMTNIKVSCQYKVVKPHGTTLYVVPAPIRIFMPYVNGWIPITISFIFTWVITLIVLREYYQRKGRLPIMLYCILILPIVFYFTG